MSTVPPDSRARDVDLAREEELWESRLALHGAAIQRARTEMLPGLSACAGLVAGALAAGGKILFCGNGGSAADAQHTAAELTVRLVGNRKALAAIALAADPSSVTACGNDFGFDKIFSRQIEALSRPGDVVVAISTSGRSLNILAALRAARDTGAASILLTGPTGGEAAAEADCVVRAPGHEPGLIQELHIVFLHALCHAVESRLGLTT
jgi:D-sedoheptulose 7-phosphate isomerase